MGVPGNVSSILSLCLMLLTPLILILGKKYLTIPRMGLVKSSPPRRAKRKKAIAALVLAVLITSILAALALTRTVTFAGFQSHLVGVILITVPLTVLAYLLQFNRLYLIAVIAGLAELIYSFIDYYLIFALAGGLILGMGLCIFTRFLQKYPKSRWEVENGAAG